MNLGAEIIEGNHLSNLITYTETVIESLKFEKVEVMRTNDFNEMLRRYYCSGEILVLEKIKREGFNEHYLPKEETE